jgi:hypothetical protein
VEFTLLRACVLAAALLLLMVPAGAEGRTSSWTSERMRLTARPKVAPFHDELGGNCAGLTVMTKTRIEWLKALEEKAGQQRWPPPSPAAQWAQRPVDGDIARQRARIAQLNAALGSKRCQTIDIDAELRRAPAAGAGPKRN